MLTFSRQYDEARINARVVLLGDPERTEQFSIDLFDSSACDFITRTDNVITLRDDNGRIICYRITDDDGDMLTGELISD